MIRILLVDDQNILRQGIQALLDPKPELKVIGTAEDGNSAIEQVGILKPDIVLMDIEMPEMNGITATRKICQQFPKTEVLILSSHGQTEYVTQALQAGAKGYLSKNTLAEDLEPAILSIARGHSQIESKLLERLFDGNTAFSRSTTLEEKNGSISVGGELLQEASIELHDNTIEILNAYKKPVGEIKENREISPNKSVLETDNEEILKSDSDYSKLKIEKLSEQSKEILEVEELQNERVREESFVRKVTTEPEQKRRREKRISLKSLKWWIRGLIVVPILLIIVVNLVRFLSRPRSQPSSASTPVPTKPPEIEKVAALGRIEPKGEVMSLSAPTSLEAVQVEQLLVKVGDRVKKGQIIAILDGRQRQQAELDKVKTQLAVAQSRLEKVKAGAKLGTIEANQAGIAKLLAELDNAQTEFQRHKQLYDEGAISASELDSKKLTFKSVREQLNEARAILEETIEVRPVDLNIARAEVEQAEAEVGKAQADMELAYVRAPIDGEILDIHTRPGEALDNRGIAEIGQTNQMMVVAEIDQNDISRVKIGQSAIVTGGVFAEDLHGKVHQVGSLIRKNDIFDTDPAADEDSRVVEVKILLNPKDSQKVAKLTNLEVDTIIEI